MVQTLYFASTCMLQNVALYSIFNKITTESQEMLTKESAYQILYEMTESPSLLRHARSVSIVMEALARHFGENEEQYAITGLLHDADYEKSPDQHPAVVVARLEALGETAIAHAIKGHYTRWNVPRQSLLDKCIVAADELTGFIVAAALIRPGRLEGMDARSVLKKLKTKNFAAIYWAGHCRS